MFGEQFWPSLQLKKLSSAWIVSAQGRKYLWPPSWDTLWRIDKKFSYEDRASLERSEAQELKPRLYVLQEGKCKYCNFEFPYEKFCVDHVKPLKKGGETSLDNCVLACRSCNSRKRTKGKGESFTTLSESICHCKNKATHRLLKLNGNYVYRCTKHLPKRRYWKDWYKKVEKIAEVIGRDTTKQKIELDADEISKRVAEEKKSKRKKYYLTDKVRKQKRDRMRQRRKSKRANLKLSDYAEAIDNT